MRWWYRGRRKKLLHFLFATGAACSSSFNGLHPSPESLCSFPCLRGRPWSFGVAKAAPIPSHSHTTTPPWIIPSDSSRTRARKAADYRGERGVALLFCIILLRKTWSSDAFGLTSINCHRLSQRQQQVHVLCVASAVPNTTYLVVDWVGSGGVMCGLWSHHWHCYMRWGVLNYRRLMIIILLGQQNCCVHI